MGRRSSSMMLRGYVIKYNVVGTTRLGRTYTNEWTNFFHLSGKYSWFPYQIEQQKIGHHAYPVWVKEACLYPVTEFIGPRRERWS